MSERAPIAEGLLVEVADRLRVLGQVVRLRLVEHLAAGSATPQEMADALGYTQQNVSKHLQILYRSGVVSRRQDGSSVVYALKDPTTVAVLDDIVASVSGHLRAQSQLTVAVADPDPPAQIATGAP